MPRDQHTGGPGDVPVVALPAGRTGGKLRAPGDFGQVNGQLIRDRVGAHDLSLPGNPRHGLGAPHCHELADFLIVPCLLIFSLGDTPSTAWTARACFSGMQRRLWIVLQVTNRKRALRRSLRLTEMAPGQQAIFCFALRCPKAAAEFGY
jgi:hypothetical protein